MLCPFIMRDSSGDVVDGTPTVVTSDGDTLTPNAGSNGWWTVDADAGVGVTATLTGAVPLDFVVPLRDPDEMAATGDAMDLIDAPNATALAAIKTAMEAAGSTLATLLSRIVGTLLAGNHNPQSGDGYAVVSNETHGNAALKTLVDAATAAAAGGYIDGDTLITQASLDTDGAAIGRTTAGATVTAYLAADTSRATPKRQATADEDGDWSIYLTGGSTYTLVFAKTGYSEATAEVTVA